MKAFSFIHASDLHLDSPFRGITTQSPSVAESLSAATFEAFESLIQLCIDRQVQFLVVSGDVYDGADRSLRAQLRFLDGLKTLADHNIRSFVAHGNHDPLDGWSSTIEWPDLVHVFGGNEVEAKTVEMDGEPVALVSGISYSTRNERHNLALRFQSVCPDLFQIGVLHCNCGGNPDHEAYAPCRLDDLIGVGLDYWALGHVHEKKVLSTGPHVVYPGNTQGLSIREPGERGCYLVSVSEDRHVDMEFCPLDAVRWLSAEMLIDDMGSIDALDRAIVNTVDALRQEAGTRPVVCRISLGGRGSLYRDLRRETAVSELLERARQAGISDDPFVWVQDIDMNCRPDLDLKERRGINDFLGQVLRVSEEIDRMDQKEALIPALDELYENRRVVKCLDSITPDELKRILREAELLCVDLLEAEE